jgi:integrase
MPVRRDKTGQWRYRKVVRLANGRKHRISGTPAQNTKLDAERAEREHVIRATSPAFTAEGIPTFAAFVPAYLAIAEMGQAPSEMASKRQRLDAHVLPQLGHLRLDAIGRADLDGLKLRLKGRAPATVNNYLAVAGAVLAYAVEVGHIAKRPSLGMLHVPPQDFAWYTDDQLDAVVAACNTPYERAAILLGGDAGLRAGEIRALRREDIGPDKLLVQRSDWFGELKAPKSGRSRPVPMSARLVQAIGECARGHASPTILVRSDGTPWTREVMRVGIARLCLSAGVENLGWHALRHSLCSRLAARGVPASAIQAIAGHSSVKTTERYMHLAPSATVDAIALLESRGKSVAKRRDD